MAMNGFVRAINGQLGTVANRRMVGGVRYKIFFEVGINEIIQWRLFNRERTNRKRFS